MNKLLLAATAVTAVTVLSGCKHTVVRTTHHPVEVVNTRTVVHEHTDVHVHEHHEAPRHTTRIIKDVHLVKPEPVYAPVPHGHGEPRRHRHEPQHSLPPAHSNSRHYRDNDRPRPPIHSNSRYYRDDAPEQRYRSYNDSPRHVEPSYRREESARPFTTPSRVITPHGDSAMSRALQEVQRRHNAQTPVPVPTDQTRDHRPTSRALHSEQNDVRRQNPAPAIRVQENRHVPIKEIRPERRESARTPQAIRSASPKIASPHHAAAPSSKAPKQDRHHAKDKTDRNDKRNSRAKDDDEDDSRHGNDRSARDRRN